MSWKEYIAKMQKELTYMARSLVYIFFSYNFVAIWIPHEKGLLKYAVSQHPFNVHMYFTSYISLNSSNYT